MEELIKILESFEEKRNQKIGDTWDADAVKQCFMPCAEKILCKGYFLINGNYIIDIGRKGI